jgi:membrane protein
MWHNLIQLIRFLSYVLRRFRRDRCLQLASSLTFTTLLALVPLATIALTSMSAFPVFADLGEQIQKFLLANMLPATAGKVIATYIEQFADRAGSLTALGTAALAVTALLMIFTIERAFNTIWRVRRQRPVAQRILLYWATLTLGPVLIGASLSMTSYVVGVSLGLTKKIPFIEEAVLVVVPFALTCAAFTLLYFTVPNRAVAPWHALAGGIVAGIAFEIMKRGFALYIAKFPTYTLVYGTFAAIPIFLLWIYFSWVLIIVGALIAAFAPDFSVLREEAKRPTGSAFCSALALLLDLATAQRHPELLHLNAMARRASLTREQAEELLERMAASGWVARSAGDRYGLVCDAESLRLAEVYREFLLDAESLVEAESREAVKTALARFASQAQSVFDMPLARLLENERSASAKIT